MAISVRHHSFGQRLADAGQQGQFRSVRLVDVDLKFDWFQRELVQFNRRSLGTIDESEVNQQQSAGQDQQTGHGQLVASTKQRVPLPWRNRLTLSGPFHQLPRFSSPATPRRNRAV